MPIIAALMLLCGGIIAQASDVSNSHWQESPGGNNAASPNGWTSGVMTPSQVSPTAREMMAALKRWYNHSNAVKSSAGTANVQTLTYDIAPQAYVRGDKYAFIVGAGLTNTASTTLNVNSLGAKTIKVATAALEGGELVPGRVVVVYYDGTDFQLQGGGSANQKLSTSFWEGPLVKQTRLANRVFMGAAVINDGTNDVFPQLDWCAQLWNTSYNGGDGLSCDGAYSQVYILGNIISAAGTPPNIATPHVGLTVGNASLNSISTSPTAYTTPRTVEFIGANNVTAAPSGGGPSVPFWTIYGEAHRVSANAGQTYFLEANVRNSVAQVTGWTPEAQTGSGTIGIELACGAGLSATGQFPCTVAQYIAANPKAWGSGLLFLDGSVGAHGPSSTISAIQMPSLYEIQWYHTGLQGRVFLDNSDKMNILSGSGILNVSSQINSVAANAVLNAPTSFVAGLAVNGTGVLFNGSAFYPQANNTYESGTTALRWLATYTKDLIVTQASPLAAAACQVGQIVADADFIYACSASGAWKRVAVAGGY